ncbi:MAG: hypothetical protein J7K20_02695 [Thermodesulfobacterium sp.]|nr:hypothetical protein [Thermodesulfobacterium sp.]
MKKAEYQDYLIEKPLCLIYCNLDSNFDIIKKHLYENFEIKEIKNLEDLIYWCKIAPVSMVIIGAKKLEEIKELGEFLNEKLPVEKRREIFLIYILPKTKTLDPKETFLLSANLVISEDHISDFKRVYQKASQYWSSLYKDFKSSYEKLKEDF